MAVERRTGERFPTQISTVFKDEGGLHFGRILDISHGGVLLESRRPLQPNTLIRILARSGTQSTTLAAQVVRSSQHASDVGEKSVGVRFIDLDFKGKAIRDDLLMTLMYRRHALPQWA